MKDHCSSYRSFSKRPPAGSVPPATPHAKPRPMADSLRRAAWPCPKCDYNVITQIEHDIRRCPECGCPLPDMSRFGLSPIHWMLLTGKHIQPPRPGRCEYRGRTLRQWAAKLGVSHEAIYSRLRRGWSWAKILSKPFNTGRPPKHG